MAKVKVKLDRAGVRGALLGAGIQSELTSRANRIADVAGPGYEASPYPWRTRGRASVITGTTGAMRDNSRNQTLLRALGAGR